LADGIFGVDDAIMGGIECHWWKFWRRLRALTEQLPRPVALAGGFEVPTGGSALRAAMKRRTVPSPCRSYDLPDKVIIPKRLKGSGIWKGRKAILHRSVKGEPRRGGRCVV
jgi:hypothetical protein